MLAVIKGVVQSSLQSISDSVDDCELVSLIESLLCDNPDPSYSPPVDEETIDLGFVHFPKQPYYEEVRHIGSYSPLDCVGPDLLG